MLSASAWELGQQNLITFVMIDSNGAEVTGLGSGFTLQISKAGGAFAASAGAKAEMGLGWYSYLATAGEADTVGPIAVVMTHASAIQQNCEYIVEQRAVNAVLFTYTLTDDTTSNPIVGAQIWICSDSAGVQVLWAGTTDALGVARDSNGNLPRLDPGTVYVYRQKAGYAFDDPDTEVIS